MINLTKLWTGTAQPADGLRYGHGSCAEADARGRKPIVVWNITRTCNLRCVHCYSDSQAMQYPGELTWEEMENVLDDLSAYQVPSLLLSDSSRSSAHATSPSVRISTPASCMPFRDRSRLVSPVASFSTRTAACIPRDPSTFPEIDSVRTTGL
jgi:hypothetical protein